jgi:acetoin utilization protein AcuB
MLVEERMRSHPITVAPQDSFRHAMGLIRQRGIRHLPVVEAGRLVGIVTDRDLRQAAPSSATSLEMHELHYLLERVNICDIMTAKVHTVSPDASIEEAACLMIRHKIGCLPVLRGSELIGIITETDLLGAIVDGLGIQPGQARLEVVLEDRPDAFLDACRIIQDQGGEIQSLAIAAVTHREAGRKVIRVHLEGVSAEPLARALQAGGYTVRPGLASTLATPDVKPARCRVTPPFPGGDVLSA